MKDWEYMGWVPCLNGHLDFGLMRPGIKGSFTDDNAKDDDLKVININKSAVRDKDSHKRKIVLQSKVNWKDRADEDEKYGWFRVFVIAETNDSFDMDERYLSGTILIYSTLAEPKRLSDRQSMALHKVSHELESLSEKRDSIINPDWSDEHLAAYENLDQEFNVSFSQLQNLIAGDEKIDGFDVGYFFASFKFRIESNGILWLRKIKNTAKADVHYVIARQAYYYLKYSLHTHKHHQAKQDALTTLVALEKEVPFSKTCMHAGLRLVCQLKRELTSLNRIKSNRSDRYKDQLLLNDACGIIAYGKALIRSLSIQKVFTKEFAERELSRFDDLKSSSDALNSKMEKTHSITELVSAKAKVITGVAAGLAYFLLGRFLVPSSGSTSISSSSGTKISDLIVSTLAVGISFGIMYFSLKMFYAWRHGLEKPNAAEKIYYRSWASEIFLIIGIVIAFVFSMIINQQHGQEFFNFLSGRVFSFYSYFSSFIKG